MLSSKSQHKTLRKSNPRQRPLFHLSFISLPSINTKHVRNLVPISQLSFVHDVLFPYALDNAVSFFSKRLSNQETSPLLFEEGEKRKNIYRDIYRKYHTIITLPTVLPFSQQLNPSPALSPPNTFSTSKRPPPPPSSSHRPTSSLPPPFTFNSVKLWSFILRKTGRLNVWRICRARYGRRVGTMVVWRGKKQNYECRATIENTSVCLDNRSITVITPLFLF